MVRGKFELSFNRIDFEHIIQHCIFIIRIK